MFIIRVKMMAPRFARHITAAALRGLATAPFTLLIAVLITPSMTYAHRHASSVTVDLSVLDDLDAPQNATSLLRPGVRSLLMPNTRQSDNAQRSGMRFAPAMPRANAAPIYSGFKLKRPPQMKAASSAQPFPSKATQPGTLRKKITPSATPPPKFVAKSVITPKRQSPPASISPPSLPIAPPMAPSITARPVLTRVAPRPPVQNITPPPAPPPTIRVIRPVSKPPRQSAALTSSSTPGGKLAVGEQFRMQFGAGTATVVDAAGAQLDSIAKALETDEALRLQLLAYSSSGAQTPSQARRMSLSRALAVRSRLIKGGVRSSRIDVRALGNKSEGGPPDRVDVIVTKR